MGSTVRFALPYPEETDRVMDGDNTLQAAFEKLDDLETAGIWRAWASGTAVLPAGGAVTSVVVTYPAGRFPSTPQSINLCMAMNSASFTMLGIGGQSATGFTAIGGSNSGSGSIATPLSFYWIATFW